MATPSGGEPSPADLMMEMVRQAEMAQAEEPPLPPVSSLAEREVKVMGGLRGNRKLMAGLDDDGRAAVLAWSEEAAHRIVADTEGLDDAAAQAILQPRVRALRRLIYSLKDAVAAEAVATPELVADLARQVAAAFGPPFEPPGPEAATALCERYNAAPADFASRCAVVRDLTARAGA
jgi:hypothetical protein